MSILFANASTSKPSRPQTPEHPFCWLFDCWTRGHAQKLSHDTTPKEDSGTFTEILPICKSFSSQSISMFWRCMFLKHGGKVALHEGSNLQLQSISKTRNYKRNISNFEFCVCQAISFLSCCFVFRRLIQTAFQLPLSFPKFWLEMVHSNFHKNKPSGNHGTKTRCTRFVPNKKVSRCMCHQTLLSWSHKIPPHRVFSASNWNPQPARLWHSNPTNTMLCFRWTHPRPLLSRLSLPPLISDVKCPGSSKVFVLTAKRLARITPNKHFSLWSRWQFNRCSPAVVLGEVFLIRRSGHFFFLTTERNQTKNSLQFSVSFRWKTTTTRNKQHFLLPCWKGEVTTTTWEWTVRVIASITSQRIWKLIRFPENATEHMFNDSSISKCIFIFQESFRNPTVVTWRDPQGWIYHDMWEPTHPLQLLQLATESLRTSPKKNTFHSPEKQFTPSCNEHFHLRSFTCGRHISQPWAGKI